ncbi:MAG: hypothetical protein WEB89_04425 [Balneolales bacterium]
MKNYKLNILIALVFLGTTFMGCDRDDDNDVPEEMEFSTTLIGTDEFPAISGEGEVFSSENEFTAAASISGAEPQAAHPWHVHEGTCASSGAIIGPPDDYSLLEVDDEGNAETSVTIFNTSLREDGDYHINVHLSEDDLDTIIACGDLNGNENGDNGEVNN